MKMALSQKLSSHRRCLTKEIFSNDTLDLLKLLSNFDGIQLYVKNVV